MPCSFGGVLVRICIISSWSGPSFDRFGETEVFPCVDFGFLMILVALSELLLMSYLNGGLRCVVLDNRGLAITIIL